MYHVRGCVSKSAHSHVIRWLIDWLIEYEDVSQSLRTPMLFDGWLIDWLSTKMCLKVCALPCYSMVDWLIDWVRRCVSKSAHSHVIRWLIDWLIEYEDVSQSLRTPMLFDGWLIDWLSTKMCLKVCALPCYSMVDWLIDWLIEYEDVSQSMRTPMLLDGWLIDWLSTRMCLKVSALWKSIFLGNKPAKLGQLQPAYGHSNRASYKTKVKTESKTVSYKQMEKVHKQRLLNQSIKRWLWGIFSYFMTQSTSECLGNRIVKWNHGQMWKIKGFHVGLYAVFDHFLRGSG